MNYKLFMKRGLCLVTMSSLLLSGCGSESTKLLSDTPADVQTESTTEEKVESKEKVSLSAGDKELLASLRKQYGEASVEYTDEMIKVDRNQNIEIPLGFDPYETEVDSWRDYFTVYQDSEMKYPIDCYVEVDYDSKTLMVEPPALGVAELSVPSGSDIDLSDLSGKFLYDDETGDDWGNLKELYLAQTMDTETGETLTTPKMTVVRVNTELSEAPVVKYSCTDDGLANISWEPVEGAKEYVLFLITKLEGEDYTTPGFDCYSKAFARTSETSWTAPIDVSEYTGDTLLMNQVFSNYISSEDSMLADGAEDMNEDFFETMPEYVGVIAITGDGSSPVSNMIALSDYAKLLPEGWAWNQNDAEENYGYAESIELLPAEISVIMCDGSTSRRVIDYDIDGYTVDGNNIEIPAKASGTMLTTSYTVYVEGVAQADIDAALTALQARQEGLKNKGGVVEQDVDITTEAPKTEDTESDSQDAEVTETEESEAEEPETEEPETEVTETEEPEAEETDTEDADAEDAAETTDVDVTANSAMSAYIAAQMLQSAEVINLSMFSESRNTDTVVDAFFEAQYQNPLVMGISDVGFDEENRDLYVLYDDSSDVTAEKRDEAKEKAAEIVSEIITDDMSDLEKEQAINAYLCENATYDDAALENAEANDFAEVDPEFNDSFTPYGVLVNGVGVCASYAGAFKVLADEAGLESLVVTGYLEGNLPHAWNRVKIDEEWLSVDATNNDNDMVSNALMNISDIGAAGVLVEDDRFVMDDMLTAYTGESDDQEYYRVNGKYYDEDAIVSELVDTLSTEDTAVLRTDYSLDDEQFNQIATSVVEQSGESLKGFYWLGVIYLTKGE